MKKYILFLLIISSCQKLKVENKNAGAENDSLKTILVENNSSTRGVEFVKNSLHRKFFNSDKIEHYYLDISEDAAIDLDQKKTHDSKILASLLMSGYPKTLVEPNLEKNLKKFKFVKTILSPQKKTEVENIFSEKDSIQTVVSGCIPYYRDIFIFKRNDTITGIAKVCFGCGVSQFHGTKIETGGFGLQSELEKLKKIIREK